MLNQHYPPPFGAHPQPAGESFAAFCANPGPFIEAAVANVLSTALANWRPSIAVAPAVDPDELHDVPAAAKLLGVVPQTIHDYVKRGILHPHRMRPGGKLYFKRGELLAALNPTTSGHDKRRKANKKA
jgi:hypothetical protein